MLSVSSLIRDVDLAAAAAAVAVAAAAVIAAAVAAAAAAADAAAAGVITLAFVWWMSFCLRQILGPARASGKQLKSLRR